MHVTKYKAPVIPGLYRGCEPCLLLIFVIFAVELHVPLHETYLVLGAKKVNGPLKIARLGWHLAFVIAILYDRREGDASWANEESNVAHRRLFQLLAEVVEEKNRLAATS